MSAADLYRTLQKARDTGIDLWAKVALQVTSSRPYARVTAAMAQPGLIAAGVLRKTREKAMAQVLGQLNMPSRDDVLSLSQRLTRMEMVLDDLRAVVDGVRPSSEQGPRARDARGAEPRVRGDA